MGIVGRSSRKESLSLVIKRMLFDKIERTYRGPKSSSEPEFDYLNRSALMYCERIRNLIEEWLSHYPNDRRKELISRFQNSDDIGYSSAFFELYLHELLLNLGYEVEIHPDIKGKSIHPEFLVWLNKKPLFYLEAAIVYGAEEKVKAEKRKDIIYDSINKMRSPDFFIGVNILASSKTSPPGRKWRNFLENEVSKLDPDKIEAELKKGSEMIPEWTIREFGWEVTFYAVPKPKEERGTDDISPIAAK